MKTACNCSANRTRTQAASLMEAAMLPALEQRALPLSMPEALTFVPVQPTAYAPGSQTAAAAQTAAEPEHRHAAGRAVLYARGIAMPGAGRAWGKRCRRMLDTGFCAGR